MIARTMACFARVDRLTWGLMLLLAGLGLYLVIENISAIAGFAVVAAPWLLLAACPLMHLLMHRGHGRGGPDDGSDDGRRNQ